MAFEYKVAGQMVRLEPDPSVVGVRFKPGPKSFRVAATAAACVGSFSDRYEIPGEELTLVPTAPAQPGMPPSQEVAMNAITALSARSGVSHALPVFRIGGNQVATADRIIVGAPETLARSLATAFKLEIQEIEPQRMVARVAEGADPFDIAEKVGAAPGVRYAEPDFITLGRHVPKRVAPPLPPILSDPLIPRQYAMTLTRAVEAWRLQAGDPRVRIAILDEGVQTAHPDLYAAIVGAYDATEGDSDQEPNRWDGHGTCCAGLAAAVGGDGAGMRGVAAGASLLAVRIAGSASQDGPWVTSNGKIRNGVKWAWENGADVLSNSWSGGAPSSDIASEFERARTEGRGGLGCVVVVAAGNLAGPVTFPASLPGVLTVSASNEYDEAKTPTSRDGETWWGTNHGPEVDIAAPGVHNFTTDITGPGGDALEDYTPDFNGASSATPIVAGACALVISANRGLTGTEVVRIVTETADKVGPFPYFNGRNDFFGAGRLNILEAVRRAKAQGVALASGEDGATGATT